MGRSTSSSVSEAATLIGPGIHVRGRVSGEEDLHIEGHLEGSIDLTETVYVATGGVVVATVSARDVVVSGVVVGNVTALDSVTLDAGAKLVGDVTAPRVILADGAVFSGNVVMGGEPPPARDKRRAARRAAPAAAPKAKAKAKPAAKAPKAAPKKKAAKKAPSRVAAIPAPKQDDDVTVVVRHAEVGRKKAAKKKTAKKAAKTSSVRARVPKPGKRRVTRR